MIYTLSNIHYQSIITMFTNLYLLNHRITFFFTKLHLSVLRNIFQFNQVRTAQFAFFLQGYIVKTFFFYSVDIYLNNK